MKKTLILLTVLFACILVQAGFARQLTFQEKTFFVMTRKAMLDAVPKPPKEWIVTETTGASIPTHTDLLKDETMVDNITVRWIHPARKAEEDAALAEAMADNASASIDERTDAEKMEDLMTRLDKASEKNDQKTVTRLTAELQELITKQSHSAAGFDNASEQKPVKKVISKDTNVTVLIFVNQTFHLPGGMAKTGESMGYPVYTAANDDNNSHYIMMGKWEGTQDKGFSTSAIKTDPLKVHNILIKVSAGTKERAAEAVKSIKMAPLRRVI